MNGNQMMIMCCMYLQCYAVVLSAFWNDQSMRSHVEYPGLLVGSEIRVFRKRGVFLISSPPPKPPRYASDTPRYQLCPLDKATDSIIRDKAVYL